MTKCEVNQTLKPASSWEATQKCKPGWDQEVQPLVWRLQRSRAARGEHCHTAGKETVTKPGSWGRSALLLVLCVCSTALPDHQFCSQTGKKGETQNLYKLKNVSRKKPYKRREWLNLVLTGLQASLCLHSELFKNSSLPSAPDAGLALSQWVSALQHK